MGYVKLHDTILRSTIWAESHTTRIVWITMMALADQDGFVAASVPGLAHQARVTREECRTALDLFLSPDPDSSTPEHEGRRIERVDRGWRLLTYEKHKELLSIEDTRRKSAERQKRKRDRDKALLGVTERDGHSLSQNVTPTPIVASASASASDLKEGSGERGSGRDRPDLFVRCPADLWAQFPATSRATLEVAMIPIWAQSAICVGYVAGYQAKPGERRTVPQWHSGLVRAIQSTWNDPRRRPKKPGTVGADDDRPEKPPHPDGLKWTASEFSEHKGIWVELVDANNVRWLWVDGKGQSGRWESGSLRTGFRRIEP